MLKLRSMLAAALMLTAVVAEPADASAIFTEGADAGNSLTTAANTGVTLTGAFGPLQINGSVSLEPSATLAGPDFVDLFCFSMGPGLFTASTGMGLPGLIADPVLYLFNSAGIGIAMDDESGGNAQALLSTHLVAGTYILAIAFAGVEPLDVDGDPIFDSFASLAVISTKPLGAWLEVPFAVDPSTVGSYSVQLAVPLPGSLVLAFAGLLALGTTRTRTMARG